jgi:nitrogen fixation NifU-like protein
MGDERGGRYTRVALDHFVNPRNVGEIENPDGVGQCGDPSCGDAVRIAIRVAGDRVAEIRFLVFGCPAAIAVGSSLTELAKGKTLDEAMELSDLDIAEELGGLPSDKLHCSCVAVNALRLSIQDYVMRGFDDAGARS